MFGSIFGKKHYRILMLGLGKYFPFEHKQANKIISNLDNAGKTSILYRFRLKEPITTIPTVGFNVETVLLGHVKFNVWDVGGQVSPSMLHLNLHFPIDQSIRIVPVTF